jgi:hypothetical protein
VVLLAPPKGFDEAASFTTALTKKGTPETGCPFFIGRFEKSHNVYYRMR